MSKFKRNTKTMCRLSQSQIDEKIMFCKDYLRAPNTATASNVDPNANMSKKTVAILGGEYTKDWKIQVNRKYAHDSIEHDFGKEVADKYVELIENHTIYRNDESAETPYTPYCVAISMYPLLERGTIPFGGASAAPKHLDSFCGEYINLVYDVSAEFAGAVATAEFLLYFHYFAAKDYGENYLETNKNEIHGKLQQIIYTLNEPCAARNGQSVFFNLSVFDRYYFDAMFGNFYFPDGTHIEYEPFNKLQKFFMEWLLEERHKAILTFPVLTEASLDENGEPKDKEWARYCANLRSKGLSFFSYNSENADSLSSCCLPENTGIVVYFKDGTPVRQTIGSYVNKKLPECGELTFDDSNEYVDSFNPETGKTERRPITGVLKRDYYGTMYTFNSERTMRSITATADHPFTVKNKNNGIVETVSAKEVYEHHDEYLLPVVSGGHDAPLWNGGIEYSPISYAAEKQFVKMTVYDIQVGYDHNGHFIANGIVTHNCRLRNELQGNEFSFTLGAGGVMAGSTAVITLNLNRFVQMALPDWKEGDEIEPVFDKLFDMISLMHKFHIGNRHIVEEGMNANLLPAYTSNFIKIEKQYCTIGLNGINEAAEYFGFEIGNNEPYLKFLARVFGTIKELNKEAFKEYGVRFNTELIPAEGLGPKNAKWDKKDGLKVKRDCYNSYIYLPESVNTSIPDKFMMHGYVGDFLDGGSACHLNLNRMPDAEFFLWLRYLAAKYKCSYWTTNVKSTCCNDCGYIDYDTTDKCPQCGSENLDYASRVIGYCTKISSWSEDRQIEESKRYYH